MVEFNVPDCTLDRTTITEAAKRNGVIVVPSKYSEEVIEGLKEQINELGYTHKDGSIIPVINWKEYCDNIIEYSDYGLMFYLYKDIFLEMLGRHWMDDDIVLIDSNDV